MGLYGKNFQAYFVVTEGGYDATLELDDLHVEGVAKPFRKPSRADRRQFVNLLNPAPVDTLLLNNHRFTTGTELKIVGAYDNNGVYVSEIRYARSNKPIRI